MAVPVIIGTATLDEEILVDSLVVDVIDGLREDLHPQFGVRAYRVYVVARTWTGTAPGDGTFTDVAGELRPQPRVRQWDGLRWTQASCGVEELGEVRLTEASLTYTESQLTGGFWPNGLAANVEAFIAIGEGNGQASATRLFAHTAPPFIDREKDMGWVLSLRRIQQGEPWAPT